MNRPLWQILFALTFAAFVVTGACVGWVLHARAGDSALLPLLYALQGLAALATALGALLDRSWATGASLTAGALFVLSTLAATAGAGAPAAAATAATLTLVVAATVGVAWMLHAGGAPWPPRSASRRAERRRNGFAGLD